MDKTYTMNIDFSDYSSNRDALLKNIYFNAQDTNTAFIEANLVNNKDIIDLTTVDKVVANIRKNDDTKVVSDCTILDASKGKIKIPFSPQALKMMGVNQFQIMITKGLQQLNSPKFYYNVDEALVSDDDIQSSNEFSLLTDLIAKTEKINVDSTKLKDDVIKLNTDISNNEATRQSNEVIRVGNEDTRKSQETTRQESVTKMRKDVDDKLAEIVTAKDGLTKTVTDKITEINTVTTDNTKKIDDKIIDVQTQLDKKVTDKFVEVDKTTGDKMTNVETRMKSIEDEFGTLVDGTGFARKTYVDDEIIKLQNKPLVTFINETTKSVIDTTEGYVRNLEIKGNTIQSTNNLADIKSVGDKISGQEAYNIKLTSNNGLDKTDINYKEHQITILSPKQLEKVGTVVDRIVEKDGIWGVEKNNDDILINGKIFEANDDVIVNGDYIKIPVAYSKVGIFESLKEQGDCITTFGIRLSGAEWNTPSKEGIYIGKNAFGIVIKISSIGGSTKTNVKDYFIIRNHYIKRNIIAPQFIPLPNNQQISLRTFANQTNILFETEIEGDIKGDYPKSIGATLSTHSDEIDNINKDLEKVKKLEEATTTTVTTESDFVNIEETSNGYLSDIKLEGKTKLLDSNHIEVPVGTVGATLKSVGEGTDEIVVLSETSNLFDGILETGSIGLAGEDFVEGNRVRTSYVKIKKNTKSIIIKFDYNTLSSAFGAEYDKDKKFIKQINFAGNFKKLDIDPNTEYIRFRTQSDSYNHYVSYNDTSYVSRKTDKKQLLFLKNDKWSKPVLRDKDTIELHSDGKYYYHIRSGERNYTTGDENNVALITDKVKTVYKLEKEEVYECTPIDVASYENETNYSISTGFISPTTTIKTNNYIGNVITKLREKVDALEDLNQRQSSVNLAIALNVEQNSLDIEKAFQRGNDVKKLLVDELISVGSTASTTDTFESLIGGISNISNGKKFATGTSNKGSGFLNFTTVYDTTVRGSYLEVRGLNFKPSTVIAFGQDLSNSSYVVLTSINDGYYNLPTAKVSFYSNSEARSTVTQNIKLTGNCSTFNDGFKVPIYITIEDVYYGSDKFNWIAYE